MRSVLVTGAYGGMGRATVACLKERGYRVFAVDLVVGEGEENVIPVQADVTSEESVTAAFETVRGQTDKLYGILHFAGIYMLDSLAEMEQDSFDKIMGVNFRGAFLVNKIFLPLLAQGSRILMTTSELATLDPLPFTGIYAVTKGALDRYTYSLRMEFQLLGIDVCVLRAGAVQTDMLGVSTAALDAFCKKTSLYSCNAARFKSIVERVESRCVSPTKIAEKCGRILEKKHPRFAYAVNRNPLLILLNMLPKSIQLWVIRMILK